MWLTLATGYKIEDMKMQKLWLILSADSFVCADNLKIITKIAEENYIDADSISVFDSPKFDIDEMEDLAQTVSFFGDRLIIIKDFDISELSEEYTENASISCRCHEFFVNNHFFFCLIILCHSFYLLL